MRCLRDYVGLKVCGGASALPPSGLYINALNGIGLDQLSSLADADQRSVEGVWSDIQDRALLRFSDDLRAAFAAKYNISNIQQSISLIKKVDSSTAEAGEASKWKGFVVDQRISSPTDDYKYSSLSSIHIQRVSFKADASNDGDTTQVKVFDLLTGDVLFSQSVTLATGWNDVEVNTTFTANHFDIPQVIFVAINADGLACFDKTIDSIVSNHYGSLLDINGAISTYASASDPVLESDLTTGSNSYGLTGEVSLKCSFDAIACSNKELFKRALWLCLGIEVMQEQLSSTRLSAYTSIGQKQAQENAEMWEGQYKESLMQAVSGISIDQSDACIECGSTYKIVEAMP
jgi:hypothetical protein